MLQRDVLLKSDLPVRGSCTARCQQAYRGSAPVRRRDLGEREELIMEHAGVVKFMALRLAARLPSHIAVDDLVNAGIIGLMDALDKYDSAQGLSFEAYAKIRIRGSMLDEIRAMDWVPRSLRQKSSELGKVCSRLEHRLNRPPTDEEMAGEMGISCSEYHKIIDEIKGISLIPEDIQDVGVEGRGSRALAADKDDVFDGAYKKELKAKLVEGIRSLSLKEQQILMLYYYEELTMKEIGSVMGYTESRISQIHTKAIVKLRTRLSRRLGKDDLPDALQAPYGEHGS